MSDLSILYSAFQVEMELSTRSASSSRWTEYLDANDCNHSWVRVAMDSKRSYEVKRVVGSKLMGLAVSRSPRA